MYSFILLNKNPERSVCNPDKANKQFLLSLLLGMSLDVRFGSKHAISRNKLEHLIIVGVIGGYDISFRTVTKCIAPLWTCRGVSCSNVNSEYLWHGKPLRCHKLVNKKTNGRIGYL